MTFRNGDIAVFDQTRQVLGREVTERHVALRRDWGWGAQWQVAIHGFWRVDDDFIYEHAEVIGNADQYNPGE